MRDMEYLKTRAAEELAAAIATSDNRVRLRHLELADQYSFRLSEAKAAARRSKLAPAD